MTNKQRLLTIEQLERISKILASIGETVDYTEFAIEALEQEFCEDCVSRKALENLKKYMFSYDTKTTIPKSDYFIRLSDIRDLQTVTPQPKTGHWIKTNGTNWRRCSECNHNGYERWVSCPRCGVRMVSK